MIARPGITGARLLLLQDEAADVDLLDRLSRGGFDVTVARTSGDALEMLTRMKFAGLVMVASAGDETTPQLVAESLHHEPGIAVVVAGDARNATIAVRCLHAGAMDYLVADAPAGVLEDAVARAIVRRQQTVQARAAERVLHEEVASLVGQLRQEKARVESLTLATLESLVRVVETKDPWLGGHSVRVAQLSASLAASMGKTDAEVEAVRLAGQLHDIGMICLGDGILSKEGPLTAEEWGQVQRHVVIGHQILEPLPHLGQVSGFVRGHHERFDGTGYPDRLVGDAIPWGARLIGAAETYDALTTTRPYRKSLSPEEAVENMRALAGSTICPVVFEALSDVVSRLQALVFVVDQDGQGRGRGQEMGVVSA